MALHRIGDADAADQQRGQADERQELREALDVALERGRGVAARADVPAGLRELIARLRRDLLRRGVARVRIGKLQPIVPAHQAAGLQQTGGAQARR